MDTRSLLISLSDDVARPAIDDYEAWARSQPRGSGIHCSGCKSRLPDSTRSAIEKCGPYVEVPESGIDESARILAHSAVSRACRELDCKRPRIRWYTTIRSIKLRKPLGQFLLAEPDSIWLLAGLPEKEIGPVSYHECKHYYDHAVGLEVTESSASAFEDRLIAAQYSRPEQWQPVVVCSQPRGTVIFPGDLRGARL